MLSPSTIFFPEPMDRVTIVCSTQSSYECIDCITDFGYVQFDDYNSGLKANQKRSNEAYMQAEEAERSLRTLRYALESHDLLPPSPNHEPITYIENPDFNEVANQINLQSNDYRERKKIFDDLQKEISMREQKLASLRFFRQVLRKNNSPQHSSRNSEGSIATVLLQSVHTESTFLLSIVGFIPVEKSHHFAKTVYRISRRNVIIETGENHENYVPYALFASSQTLMHRIRKAAEAYGTYFFEFSQDDQSLDQAEQEIQASLNQMKLIDDKSRRENLTFLNEIRDHYWAWVTYIATEKLIFMAQDYGDFEANEGSVVYSGWCPTRFVPELRSRLNKLSQNSSMPVPIHIETQSITLLKEDDVMPPTYIETNSFTSSFQSLNDAYGIPNYDELNGGAFYCTYPFLFGIMFGDMGHAFFYLLASFAVLALDPIMKRKRIDLGEIGNSLFGFKWLLFFASLCAFYCGFIYNECFGLPIDFFGSHYRVDPSTLNGTNIYKKTGPSIYPFGMDPVWFFKDNELIFMNSYKMKLAVVMGMCQMIFGLFLGLVNHIHRKNITEILVTWIPQFLYLVPFFGYLVVLIITKWTTDFSQNPDEEKQKDGVNLIQVMISMILQFGAKDYSLELYGSLQWTIQKVILFVFLASIPCLLFLRPIVDIIKKHKREDFNLLEIFVMNLIGVIEFCLGALSHTASYLRLWALSLAHSQLSHVLHDELFVMTINTGNFVLTFVGFAAYAAMSVAILLGMEAFSALLHGIRLMWVEFSSKFYIGMGFEFQPASKRQTLQKEYV